jgi:hypothetical protein
MLDIGQNRGNYVSCDSPVREMPSLGHLKTGCVAYTASYMRFEVFTAVTRECRLLGCAALWLM